MDKTDSMELLTKLERIAQAVETLAEEPKVEIDAGPPLCPHCGANDPMVRVIYPREDTEGLLSEFCYKAICAKCGRTFYGAIESYCVFQNAEGLEIYLKERAELITNAT